MNYNDWKWWKDKLHNYKEVDSLSTNEKSRLIFCCLEFIVNSLQPERSKREDSQCHNCFKLEEAIGNCFSQDGHCSVCGRLVRCGALNISES